MTHVSWALAAVVVVTSATAAHAQSAEAEVLFRDGRALIKQGKLAAGCDKIEASEKLETSLGTLLNLGDCRERLGKLATAWAAFRKAEAIAKRSGGEDKRQAEANRRATALESKLANLVIEVGQPVVGLVVRRGGVVVDPASWNTAVPVDPSSYVIVAEAPGYKPWRLDLVVDGKNHRQVVHVPALVAVPIAITAPDRPDLTIDTPVVMRRVPTTHHRTWSGTRRLAVGFGIVGAAALGAGTYFGFHARDLQNRADARCPTAACGDPDGLRLNDQAQSSARRANVSFVAGGAAAVIGGVLWLVGRPTDELIVAPTIGEHHAGVSIGRKF